jgi:hypothetical protein
LEPATSQQRWVSTFGSTDWFYGTGIARIE